MTTSTTTALVSYATANFQLVREELIASAAAYGISKSLRFSEPDLQNSSYFTENQSVLLEMCGAGYWAWKPFFILEALKQLHEGDVALYCDSGSRFIASPQPLIDLVQRQTSGLVLFDARPLKNRQFTKRDCFVKMGCDAAEYWDAHKLIATVVVVRKCELAIQFVKEWLHYCKDRAAITDDPNQCGLPELPGFLQHRHDQAILSVLAAKHRIETFRNPSVWGNFLKLPEFRVEGEATPSPYNLIPEIRGYAAAPQFNSPYGTIFEFNRQPNWIGKRPIQIRHPESRWSRLRRLIAEVRPW